MKQWSREGAGQAWDRAGVSSDCLVLSSGVRTVLSKGMEVQHRIPRRRGGALLCSSSPRGPPARVPIVTNSFFIKGKKGPRENVKPA